MAQTVQQGCSDDGSDRIWVHVICDLDAAQPDVAEPLDHMAAKAAQLGQLHAPLEGCEGTPARWQ
jgi:hypothetical protein